MAQVTVARPNEWHALLERVQRRVITALDLISILICDAVILGAGFGVISVTEHFRAPDQGAWSARVLAFFEVARDLSAGLFLLLYVVVVGFHVWRFFKQELSAGEKK